jgi:uncharacterized protein
VLAPPKREDRRANIPDLVARAARLLPEQSPPQTFVHHNTLHAFEHLPFDDAVVRAARLFGTEPFQSEVAFQSCVDSGRIRQMGTRRITSGSRLHRSNQTAEG